MNSGRKGFPKATHFPKCESQGYETGLLTLYGRSEFCIGGKKVVTKTKRWYKDVGLGFKTPSEAINGTYIGVLNLHLLYGCLLNLAHSRQEVPLHW